SAVHPLSLHDALPICNQKTFRCPLPARCAGPPVGGKQKKETAPSSAKGGWGSSFLRSAALIQPPEVLPGLLRYLAGEGEKPGEVGQHHQAVESVGQGTRGGKGGSGPGQDQGQK